MHKSLTPTLNSNWIRSFLDEHCGKSPILLAVSGGLDSMVLWDLVHKSKVSYAVAHVNYNLRGVESNGDQKLVEDLAKTLGTKLFVHSDNSLSKDSSGLQAIAREVRYAFFQSLREQFPKVCTAHHADDQVETVLLQVGRGGGPNALAGISTATQERLRPLLSFYKGELAAYAKTHRIPFREDSSNSGDDYLRNRVRHHLVPLAEKLFDGFRQNINKTALQQQELLAFAEMMVQVQLEKYRSKRWPHTLDRSRISQLPGNSYFIHELIRMHEFSPYAVSSISAALIDSIEQKRKFLNREASVQVVISGQTIHLESTKICDSFELKISQLGISESPLGYLVVSKSVLGDPMSESEIWVPTLENLTWRTTSADDSIQISSTETKTAKRVLAEAKHPPLSLQRSSTLVLNDKPIWIVNVRKNVQPQKEKAKTAGYRLRFNAHFESNGILNF